MVIICSTAVVLIEDILAVKHWLKIRSLRKKRTKLIDERDFAIRRLKIYYELNKSTFTLNAKKSTKVVQVFENKIIAKTNEKLKLMLEVEKLDDLDQFELLSNSDLKKLSE